MGDRPAVVYLAVTERCTVPCVHCHIWRAKGTDLPTDAWLGFIDRIAAFCSQATVHLVGGEPLMRPDLERIAEHAVRSKLTVGLCTNGWLVTEDRARSLAGAGVSVAYVSLDGVRAATVDATRGKPGSFDHAMRAIDLLLGQKGMTVVLSSILHGQNAGEFPGLIDLAQRRGAHLMMQTLNQTLGAPIDPAWWRRSPLWPKTDAERAAVEAAIDALVETRMRGGNVLNTDAQLEASRRYYRDPTAPPSVPCPAGVTDLGIGAGGDVRLCFYRSPIGSLLDSAPLDEIWNGDAARARRTEVFRCMDACRLNTSNISALGSRP